uniref:Uncharacterized protein n=1 Tax=Vitis vinifera TaxID=29760 RepID=A5BZF9_VITVI|nr:hypothetical protein VITISV_000476 [Vitis vinifera]
MKVQSRVAFQGSLAYSMVPMWTIATGTCTKGRTPSVSPSEVWVPQLQGTIVVLGRPGLQEVRVLWQPQPGLEELIGGLTLFCFCYVVFDPLPQFGGLTIRPGWSSTGFLLTQINKATKGRKKWGKEESKKL